MIEDLKGNNLKLTEELGKSNDHVTKVKELKRLAEERVSQLNTTVQAAEMEKQLLRQEVQNLAAMVDYLRNTAVKSVNDCLNRLKLDLNSTLVGEIQNTLQDVY